jgi:hypothetical protein
MMLKDQPCAMTRMAPNSFRMLTAFLCLGVLVTQNAAARSFRPSQMPNGTVIGCANCHVNPAGGGTRTPFGQAVFSIIGGSSAQVPFWSPTLAALDSDGDLVSNGQELGDPDGDGVPTAGVPVSNPGNRPPAITSTPVTNAVMGLAFQYAAIATDTEANTMTFAKVSGPAWLNVATNGQVTGTPPDGAAGVAQVQIQVRDLATSTKGNSRQTNIQTFALTTISSLAGWQKMNFNLPTENALADPLADPDEDGLPNLVEYALRLNPRTNSVFQTTPPRFDSSHHLQIPIAIRDDDPKLGAQMETDATVLFPAPSVITTTNVTASTPTPGFKTLLFTDTVAQTNTASRFGKIKLLLLP